MAVGNGFIRTQLAACFQACGKLTGGTLLVWASPVYSTARWPAVRYAMSVRALHQGHINLGAMLSKGLVQSVPSLQWLSPTSAQHTSQNALHHTSGEARTAVSEQAQALCKARLRSVSAASQSALHAGSSSGNESRNLSIKKKADILKEGGLPHIAGTCSRNGQRFISAGIHSVSCLGESFLEGNSGEQGTTHPHREVGCLCS